MFSNLLVPGIYVFRELQIDPRTFLKRTLCAPLAGGLALVAATWALRALLPVTYPGTIALVALDAARRAPERRYAGVHRRVSADAASVGLDAIELAGKLLRRWRDA